MPLQGTEKSILLCKLFLEQCRLQRYIEMRKTKVLVSFKVPEKAFQLLKIIRAENKTVEIELSDYAKTLNIYADLFDYPDYTNDVDDIEDFEDPILEVFEE